MTMNEYQELSSSGPTQTPPPNYLAWAIVTTILCCLPFGIVSIVYAAQVNSKWQTGDYAGARIASKNAKTWAWVSFAAGIAFLLIWSLLMIVGAVAGLGLGMFE
jgi:hypothetical protein